VTLRNLLEPGPFGRCFVQFEENVRTPADDPTTGCPEALVVTEDPINEPGKGLPNGCTLFSMSTVETLLGVHAISAEGAG